MSEATKPSAAAGGFPAPIAFLASLLVSWGLQRAFPLPAVAGVWRWIAGAALIVLGLPYGFGALRAMREAKTSPNPFTPSAALVTSGPFRFSRNPMYVSLVLYLAGLGILFGLTWQLVLLPVVVLVLHYGAVVPEERHMQARFGDPFARYRARVRPWI
jgi:protein-S-isoprenylcysteine O-methyltransferase Ste14